MNNITTCNNYSFNNYKEIVSNNMKLFCIALNQQSNSNGFYILDDNFKTPQHQIIYYLIKSVTDSKSISMEDYNIVLRGCVKDTRVNYDMYIDYGENHDMKTTDGNTIQGFVNDFQMMLYFNDNENNIIIGTDLDKNNIDNEPIINEITFFRPQMMSSFTNCHIGSFILTINNKIEKNMLKENNFFISVDFIKKNIGIIENYPIISNVFENENELYKTYDILYPFYKNKELFVNNITETRLDGIEFNNIIINEKKIYASDNNTFLNLLLKKNNYTFEKLYKSMFPGVYSNEKFVIEHYSENYSDSDIPIEDINCNFENCKCIGYQNIPKETRNIIFKINEYMKFYDISYLKLTK